MINNKNQNHKIQINSHSHSQKRLNNRQITKTMMATIARRKARMILKAKKILKTSKKKLKRSKIR